MVKACFCTGGTSKRKWKGVPGSKPRGTLHSRIAGMYGYKINPGPLVCLTSDSRGLKDTTYDRG